MRDQQKRENGDRKTDGRAQTRRFTRKRQIRIGVELLSTASHCRRNTGSDGKRRKARRTERKWSEKTDTVFRLKIKLKTV